MQTSKSAIYCQKNEDGWAGWAELFSCHSQAYNKHGRKENGNSDTLVSILH